MSSSITKFRAYLNQIRPYLRRYKIKIYNKDDTIFNARKDDIQELRNNFNYTRLYKDVLNKTNEINRKQINNKYTQNKKNSDLRGLRNITSLLDVLYSNFKPDLTESGIQRNVKDIETSNREIYKKFRPLMYSRENPQQFKNKWGRVYRNYSLSSVYNDNILNENIERKSIEPLLQHLLNKLNNRYKYKITVELTVEDLHGIQQKLTFSSPHFITVDVSTDLYDSFITALLALKNSIINKLPNSQMRVVSYDKVFITSYRINELNGSSYIDYKGKNGASLTSIINPHNNDNKCFYWATLAGMIKHRKEDVKNLERITVIKKQMKELKINIDETMLKYPVKIDNNEKMISEFEIKNNLSINIYINNNDNKSFHLGYHTHNENKEQINLLLITNKETGNYHYIYLMKVLSNNKSKNKLYLCKKCNSNIRSRDLESHYKKCVNPKYIYSYYKHKDIYDEAKLLNFKNSRERNKYIINLLMTKPDFKNMMKYYETGKINEELYCPFCQNVFENEEEFNYHKYMGCAVIDDPRQLIFNTGKVSFNKYETLNKINTIGAADFETILEEHIEGKGKQYINEKGELKYNTNITNIHKPLMHDMYFKSEKYIKPIHLHSEGKTDEEVMIRTLIDIVGTQHYLSSFYKNNNLIKIDDIDENIKKEFRKNHNDGRCYICHKKFDENKEQLKSVIDHDHKTGELLGMACKRCNGYRVFKQKFIPLYYHNGSGYDYHLIFNYIDKFNNNILKQIVDIPTDDQDKYFEELKKIDPNTIILDEKPDYKLIIKSYVPKNSERFLSFELSVENGNNEFIPMKFLDSRQMIGGSLEEHVDCLRKQEKQDNIRLFKCMESIHKDKTDLLLQKNLLPYYYFDNYNKFDNPISDLLDEKIYDREEKYTEEKYETMLKVIKEFNIKTTGEYYKLYLSCDVLQLMDILINYRERLYNYFGLDMCYYLGVPSFCYNAFLYFDYHQNYIKNNKTFDEKLLEIEKINDTNMFTFFRKAMRGGQSYICTRYAKANNIFCDDYDETKPYTYIEYLDMTNLYGGAMKLPLPYKDFKKLTEEELKRYNEDIKNLWIDFPSYNLTNPRDNINVNQDYDGCWLEVKFKIPEEIHDKLYDYPLAPEHVEIKEDMISNYTKNLQKRMGKKHVKQNLLTQTLYEKDHYIIYYKTLYLYIELGLIPEKIYSGYRFKERALMRNYVMFNTENRNIAKKNKNELEIILFKLMNNSVYGKTMENELNYSDFDIVNDPDKLVKYTSLPTFKNGVLMNNEMFLVENVGTKISINKPIYLGATICDLSKLLMFKFYHKDLIPEFKRENVKLLFTDTDSLCVLLTSKNEEERIKHYENLIKKKVLDCSTYSENHSLNKLTVEYGNKNEIGTMKCEEGEKIMLEFVGLRSKMYSIKFKNGDEEKKCKGVNKKTMKEIRFDDYKRILFNTIDTNNKEDLLLIKEMDRIGSKKQKIYSIKNNKVALSCDDTKRFILNDGINTLPFGHYKCKN